MTHQCPCDDDKNENDDPNEKKMLKKPCAGGEVEANSHHCFDNVKACGRTIVEIW